MKKRVDIGIRLAGDKAVLADEFVTRSQITGGVDIAVNGDIVVVGDLHYVHKQNSANTTWNIVHNLGKYPAISIVDTANTVLYGVIEYVNEDELNIYFKFATAGKAYLN